MKRISIAVIAFIFLLLGGCKVVRAPKGTIPTRKGLSIDTYGSWVIMNLKDSTVLWGELLAVESDTILVLSDNNLKKTPIRGVASMEVVIYKPLVDELVAFVFLSSLLTLSNGYYLVFTLPLHIISGAVMIRAEMDRDYHLSLDYINPFHLRKYARFPQGIPPGLDLTVLKSKPRKN